MYLRLRTYNGTISFEDYIKNNLGSLSESFESLKPHLVLLCDAIDEVEEKGSLRERNIAYEIEQYLRECGMCWVVSMRTKRGEERKQYFQDAYFTRDCSHKCCQEVNDMI